MTFRQLLNVRILQNLATTRESISPQKVSEEIFEIFFFMGHLLAKARFFRV